MANNNKLVIKYSLLFLFLLSTSVLILLFEKNNQIEKQKEEIEVKNRNIINLYKNETKEVSDLFFFNYVLKNTKLQAILNSKEDYQSKFVKIDNLYKNKLSYFTNHKIKEINIYEKDATVIYKSAYEKYNNSLNLEHRKTIQKVANEFDTKVLFSINDSNPSIKYLRPIFDKNLKLLAIFEVSMDLPKLIHDTFINKSYQVDFIFDISTLKNNLSSKFLDEYSKHHVNSNYVYQKSFYSNRFITKKIPEEYLEEISKNMEKKYSFVIDYSLNNKYYIVSFLPLPSKKAYVVLYVESDKYSNTVKTYDIYIYIASLVLFIYVLLLFVINYYLVRYKDTKSKLDGINKSIDKYVIVAETDLKGNITYASEAFCNVSGYKKAELIGKPMNTIRHPDISKRFYENMWSKLKSDLVWEGEIKNIDQNGNSYWVRGNILPIFDIDNKKIGYRAIRVNISDEKQLLKVNSLLKRDLFLKLNEIKTRDKMNIDQSKIVLMGQILDAFSNEWKKPISNLSSKILTFENNINENAYDKTYLSTLSKELSMELNILSMHLNEFKNLFSHNENEDRYNVYDSIKTAISSVSKNDITINLSGDKEIETYGVSYDLKKIVLGIVYNSFEEFRKKKINEARIDISINKTKDNLLIKCKDNAGGIPKEFLSKIFETGFSTKDNLSSRGLPLHIAKLIVQKLDSDLWVKNEDDGCCFYIKLITKDRREKTRDN